MSWSRASVGRPSAVVADFEKYGDSLTAESRREFDQIREGLKAIILANSEECAVHVDASGHAYGETSSCNVSVKRIGWLAPDVPKPEPDTTPA